MATSVGLTSVRQWLGKYGGIFHASGAIEAQRMLNAAPKDWQVSHPRLATWAEKNLPHDKTLSAANSPHPKLNFGNYKKEVAPTQKFTKDAHSREFVNRHWAESTAKVVPTIRGDPKTTGRAARGG